MCLRRSGILVRIGNEAIHDFNADSQFRLDEQADYVWTLSVRPQYSERRGDRDHGSLWHHDPELAQGDCVAFARDEADWRQFGGYGGASTVCEYR